MALLNQVGCPLPDSFKRSPWNDWVLACQHESEVLTHGPGENLVVGSVQEKRRIAELSHNRFCKSAFDHIVSAILLVLLTPVMVTTILLVWLTSKGFPIYCQTRLGRNGKPFVIYKLRTMRHHCERLTGAQWAISKDPRITPVGRFLRKTHLDELPQLINVLHGEMSLVGPRPERPEIVSELVKFYPTYCDREAMLPGVTGLAQVQLPPDTDIEDVRHKLACDLYYLENCSFWLDTRIVLGTALKVIFVPCSLSCEILGIPSAKKAETLLAA